MNETQSWLTPGVISGIVTVAVLVLFALLKFGCKKVFDLKPRICDTQRPLKQLSKEYGKWELLSGPVYLAICALICWLLVRVAVWIGDSIALNSPASIFNFEVSWAIYTLSGLFLAMVLGLPPSYFSSGKRHP